MNLSVKTSYRNLLTLVIQGGALEIAADEGISHYRRCSQASRRGAMFDDCFHAAKSWIDKYGDKPTTGSKRKAKSVSKQTSMF
ncbi:hypothetical protein PPN82_06845 [Proteus mirabilis]|uniref:hypothetical protein n=1 Tax=Proteus mirabilis TaxID=584 RepID=UPI0023490B2A|nr:hypothetical protein [Proteus mirabilis]MDC5890840.1 hypothetical protein [Proteus mirabilis]MDC5911977.1 hypothetical protein [Proteus mirabilis]MDC6003926.1 hypothetical protein [Proteus mirabilis]